MRDLPATPPLEGAADLADSLQINIGLMVEGQGFPSWPAPDPGEPFDCMISSTSCCQGGGRGMPWLWSCSAAQALGQVVLQRRRGRASRFYEPLSL